MEPTLRQLDYLVAVAEAGTFVSAAEVLGVSQPALSAQVAEAERRLGVTIFERGRSGATVTPEGAPLIEAARRVLDVNRELVRLANERSGDIVGSLTIGVIPTMAPYLLPAIVREVRRRYPAAELYLRERRTSDLVGDIHSGDVDFGVLASPVPELDGSLDVAELAQEPFVLATPSEGVVRPGSGGRIAGGPIASVVAVGGAERNSDVDAEALAEQTLGSLGDHDRNVIDLDALDGLPMLLLEDGHCLREHAASACEVIGVRQFGTVQANGLASLTQMVAAGMGATLLPSSAIAVEARAGSGIRIHRLAEPVPSRSIVMAWRPSAARAEHYRVLADALAPPVASAAALND